MSTTSVTLRSSPPLHGQYLAEDIVLGAGVAIFHLASSRVVVCYHTKNKYWFLPKGRKNANEDIRVAAQREGYEESGYHNRLLPLPLRHRQTDPDEGHEENVIEAIWIQFLPVSRSKQYLLHWYAAETVPPEVERTYVNATRYTPPPAFINASLQDRIALDITTHGDTYEPVRHLGTGVNEDEYYYESYLLTIDEAMFRLRSSVMADVVRRAWQAIQERKAQESAKV